MVMILPKKEKIGMNKMFIEVVHVTNIFSCKQDFTIKIYTYSILKIRTNSDTSLPNTLQ